MQTIRFPHYLCIYWLLLHVAAYQSYIVNIKTHQSHSLEIMLSGNKRARDADAIQDKELTKRPTTEAAENRVSNQQQSANVEGDESWYYELEAALEQEEDPKEKEEAKEQEKGNEVAEGSHADVKEERLSAAAKEHWKEKARLRKLEKKWIHKIQVETEEDDECLETYDYDNLHFK